MASPLKRERVTPFIKATDRRDSVRRSSKLPLTQRMFWMPGVEGVKEDEKAVAGISAEIVVDSGSLELVVVAHPSDQLAKELVDLAREQKRSAMVLDVFAAAQLFSISIDSAQAMIEPDLPLFLRVPAPPMLRTSFDEEFLFNESLATLWSVAALCKSPVINRPTSDSFGGRVSHSAALTELRAGINTTSLEIFSSSVAPAPVIDVVRQWYVQNIMTQQTTAWPALPEGHGPYCARWSDPEPVYEVVVVLGIKAWRCTSVELGYLELNEQSIALVQRLGLIFATVTWVIAHDLSSATAVNIEPFPLMEQVKYVWPELGPALLEELFS